MTGVQLTRRYVSWAARSSRRRIQRSSKKVALSFWQDLVTFRLIPIKITFFFIMGATQCVLPFATLFIKALGLTIEETAIIFTVSPIVTMFVPFLAGVMADKIGNFRKFLICTVALSGILSLMNIAIPSARTQIDEPDPIQIFSTCYRGSLRFHLQPEEGCTFLNTSVELPSLELHECGYFCPEPPPIIIGRRFLAALEGSTVTYYYNSTFKYSCDILSEYRQKCYIQKTPKDGLSSDLVNVPRNLSLSSVVLHLNSMTESQQILIPRSTYHGPKQRVLLCDEKFHTNEINLPKLLITAHTNETPEEVQQKAPIKPVSGCYFHCTGEIPVEDICQEPNMTIDNDVELTFYSVLIIRIIGSLMIGLTYSMFEAAVISILKEHHYDYGFQRIYGSIGGMLFAPLTGLIVDYFGNDSYTDYYVCFVLYFLLKLICSMLLVKLDLGFKNPASSIRGNLGKIFRNIECILLIAIVFVSGMCYGFIEHFLPWYLRDLGAENWLIGSMTTVSSLASIPFLAFSGLICDKFGYVQSISFGLLCYSVRCIGYSSIQNPIWCLPFELLEGVTTGLLVATAIIYGAKLSSKSSVGTMQGILATFHYGVGKSLGSLTGGYIMAKLSGPIAFRIYCGFSFIIGFAYYLFFKLHLQPKQILIEKQKQEITSMPIEIVPINQKNNKIVEFNPSPYKSHPYKFSIKKGNSSKSVKLKEPHEIEGEPASVYPNTKTLNGIDDSGFETVQLKETSPSAPDDPSDLELNNA